MPGHASVAISSRVCAPSSHAIALRDVSSSVIHSWRRLVTCAPRAACRRASALVTGLSPASITNGEALARSSTTPTA